MVPTRGIIKTGTLVDEHLKHLVQSGHQHTRVVERAGGNASIVVELLHRNARDRLVGSQDRRQRCDDVMLRAELQRHWDVAQAIVLLASHKALHHLAHVRCDDAGHQSWGVHKAVRELNFLHLLFQHISNELLHRFLFLLIELSPVLLVILLRLIQVQLEVLVRRVHGHELAVLEALNRIDNELVDVLVQEKNIPLPLHELFHVRGGQCCLPVRAAEVVNVLLPLLRHAHVLLQGNQLTLGLVGALEAQQLQEVVLVTAEVSFFVLDDAGLQEVGVALEELVVLLRVFLGLLLQEPQNPPHNRHAELFHQAGVLHVFSADVHGHVLAIHNSLHPVKPLRDDAICMLLDHDPPRMQRNTYFGILGEHPARGVVRIGDIETTFDGQRGVRLIHQSVVWLSIGVATEETKELQVLLLCRRALHPQSLLLVDRLWISILADVDWKVNERRELLGGLLHRYQLGKFGGIIFEG
mmetsp:Transcript_95474/g.227419  ORF Transcript_95474/g.227419 Transcript_95474/m.227419 type:complete len:468 (+) Transcript_95474:337-1740(+)